MKITLILDVKNINLTYSVCSQPYIKCTFTFFTVEGIKLNYSDRRLMKRQRDMPGRNPEREKIIGLINLNNYLTGLLKCLIQNVVKHFTQQKYEKDLVVQIEIS